MDTYTEKAVAAENVTASSSSLYVTSGVDTNVKSAFEVPKAEDTEPEQELVQHIELWLSMADLRFKHLLTGMANSTAEAVKYLGIALEHLGDHIKQQTPTE